MQITYTREEPKILPLIKSMYGYTTYRSALIEARRFRLQDEKLQAEISIPLQWMAAEDVSEAIKFFTELLKELQR